MLITFLVSVDIPFDFEMKKKPTSYYFKKEKREEEKKFKTPLTGIEFRGS